MKLNFKNITIIVLIIIIFLTGFFISKHFSQKKIDKAQRELKIEKIRNDTLVQLDSVTYKKLLADTLTKRQLRKKVKELEIELKDPKIVEVIKFVPKEIIKKEVNTVIVKDSIVNIVDYYPQKENYFIKYSSTINTLKQKALSDWEFSPQEISLGIGVNDKGMYEVITKVPEFIKITSIDVQSLPQPTDKKDNFGFLVGGGYGKELNTDKEFFNLNSGIRYKKTYLILNIATNETINIGLTFEF